MFESVARIAHSQPNEAMVRITPLQIGTISLDLSFRVKISRARFFELDTKLFSMGQIYSKSGLGSAVPETGQLTTTTTTRTRNFVFSPAAVSAGPPV
jgi:hypothetical protein